MIWNEELSASLDQSGTIVVLHRIESSRTQQLAQTLAEKIGAMVEQNEKALDLKLGGTGGWNDRADGGKGEKRGEQAQGERRGGDRSRGTRGEACSLIIFTHHQQICCIFILHCRWTWRSRVPLFPGIGEPNVGASVTTIVTLNGLIHYNIM